MGGVVAINKKDYTQIGTYFVMEEYRHSGIGSMLFKEVLKDKSGAFQASRYIIEIHFWIGFIEKLGNATSHDICCGRRNGAGRGWRGKGFHRFGHPIRRIKLSICDLY